MKDAKNTETLMKDWIMDTAKMAYPFGRCAGCGKEFNSELRNGYNIAHCPWCGQLILDYFHDKNPPPGLLEKPDINRFYYCENCGTRIYERSGQGGHWLNEDETGPGVCSGPCERELCGRCGDWDENGECEMCRNNPCEQCRTRDVSFCVNCEHLAERKIQPDWKADKEEEENPFKGREDERNCHCNNCCARFREGEIRCRGEEEYCPVCGLPGFIEDDPRYCYGCPKKNCKKTSANCKSPCPACPQEHDCYNESTGKRNECRAFAKFQKEVNCG